MSGLLATEANQGTPAYLVRNDSPPLAGGAMRCPFTTFRVRHRSLQRSKNH
jgi:hypothetical protein